MDAYTHTKLDQIRDTQRDHGTILSRIEAAAASRPARPALIPKLKLSPFWQTIAAGALTWGVTFMIGSYLRHGGDPVKVIELLLKLLGSMVGV